MEKKPSPLADDVTDTMVRRALYANGVSATETGGRVVTDDRYAQFSNRCGKMSDEGIAEIAEKAGGAELAGWWKRQAFRALVLAEGKEDNASYWDLIRAAGVATDKMRLLQGESTENIAVAGVVEHKHSVGTLIEEVQKARLARAKLIGGDDEEAMGSAGSAED